MKRLGVTDVSHLLVRGLWPLTHSKDSVLPYSVVDTFFREIYVWLCLAFSYACSKTQVLEAWSLLC